ncbi:hypothetical protein CSB11_01885 [Candidatus Campbellbacteria bacterium]|nr:MAG: hypothetical protein CSB11_01885 [Candidatus Campbellbacteria bacterium]
MNNNFKKFLPSRKVVAFVIVPLFFVVLFILIESYFKKGEIEKKVAKEKLEKSIKYNVSEKDTDDDGLLDWQERLYKTDVNNPDTDNDGVLDGKEVKKGTDPTDTFNSKKSQNDVKKINEDTEKQILNKELNVTEKVARELFMKTVDIKKEGLNKNIGALNFAAEELYEESDIFKISKILTEKDLKISESENLYDFKQKFNKVLLKRSKVSNLEAEWVAAYKFIVEKKDEGKESLEKNLHFYIVTQKELLKLEVPNDKIFIKVYLDYLNSYFFIIEYIEQVLNYKEDPLKALAFFESFDKINDIIIKRGKEVYKYLND